MTETLAGRLLWPISTVQTVLLPAGKISVCRVTVKCSSLVIKVLPWVWISKSWTNKLFMKYINQLRQQLNYSGWTGPILQFWRAYLLCQPCPLISEQNCFVIDTMQGWWRWLVRKAHTGEKVCVRSDSSILGTTFMSWVYFHPCLCQWLDQKKSPDSLLAYSLLNKQRSEDRTAQVLVSWGHMFISHTLWSVTTVAYLSCYTAEGTTFSKDKFISSTWCDIYKCFSSEFHDVTLILKDSDLNLLSQSWKCSFDTRKVY